MDKGKREKTIIEIPAIADAAAICVDGKLFTEYGRVY